MNLVFLPKTGSRDEDGWREGGSDPASGEYEFMHATRDLVGPYMACALFSPMIDFTSQLQAVDVARAAMVELFKPENRAETDRSADIRALRAAEIAPPPEPEANAVPPQADYGGLAHDRRSGRDKLGPRRLAPRPQTRPDLAALLTGLSVREARHCCHASSTSAAWRSKRLQTWRSACPKTATPAPR